MNLRAHDRTFQDILVAEGLISATELARLLGRRENAVEPVEDMLVRIGLISHQDRARCLGKVLGIPYIDLACTQIDTEAARRITQAQAIQYCALPIAQSASSLTVAMANPLDIPALDQLQRHTGREIEPLIAAPEEIREAITRVFGQHDDLLALLQEASSEIGVGTGVGTEAGTDGKESGKESSRESTREDDPLVMAVDPATERSPVVRLVNAIVARATALRASDIHLNPERQRLRVRFRVDGMLQEALTVPRELQHVLTSRLKIMSGMDIAERRAPQDGRVSLTTAEGEYDLRISTYPALYGENLVMRLLDKRSAQVSLDRLGLEADMLATLNALIRQPYGMVLVCGPTGAGKTTTLYACLNALNSTDRNIMTIEDPVEYQLAGIVQGNVNPKAGITFATGLRSLVRQDPDIILVGEIRDQETARIAIEAALTGHLVFSTIHANDAAGAITRLTDMGIEPFFIASALLGTLAQRLIRLVCPRCAAPYLPQPALLTSLRQPATRNTPGGIRIEPRPHNEFAPAAATDQSDRTREYVRGAGCLHCHQTGYRGRMGIYELLVLDAETQRLLLGQAPASEVARTGLLGGHTLRDAALAKLDACLTTPEEVMRVTMLAG